MRLMINKYNEGGYFIPLLINWKKYIILLEWNKIKQ